MYIATVAYLTQVRRLYREGSYWSATGISKSLAFTKYVILSVLNTHTTMIERSAEVGILKLNMCH